MKKLFLNLSILNLLVISNIGLFACDKIVGKHNNTNTNTYTSLYDIGETKDFDLKSFTATDFQSLANDKISEKKYTSSDLENQIRNKVSNTIFEQITGARKDISNELKALQEINLQIVNFKFELINKNQQLKTEIEVNKWEYIESFFEATAFPTANHRLIKDLARLGLNNVKKYYDHIKNNKTEFIIEYGDKAFYSDIESAKKILEEDNGFKYYHKKSIDDYDFYVNLNSAFVEKYVEEQLQRHVQKLLVNQTEIQATIITRPDWNILRNPDSAKYGYVNDLDPTYILRRKKLPNQSYQSIISITDKNGYIEYVPIKFQVKDINLLIGKIKQVDFTQLVPRQNQVAQLSSEVEKHIHETFKETEKMQIIVTILNEQQTSELEDKEYNLNVEIQQVNFQVKWKINLFNLFNNNVNKIEQNLALPSNFYAGINSQSELTSRIADDLKRSYDKDKFSVYITSELLKDEINEKEYNEYRAKFLYDVNKLADFDSRKILAPVKYVIKLNVSSKNVSWLSKVIEKTILITEKP